MSTDQTLSINSTSSDATELLGEKLGRNLRGGETIELISDLGGGKTTLMRGIAKGAGSTDHVSSPTFKISNEYKTPRFNIVHFDFYRLDDAGIVANEIAEAIEDEDAVVVIEWGKVVEDVIPKDCLKVRIKTTSADSREIEFSFPAKLSYIVEGLA